MKRVFGLVELEHLVKQFKIRALCSHTATILTHCDTTLTLIYRDKILMDFMHLYRVCEDNSRFRPPIVVPMVILSSMFIV